MKSTINVSGECYDWIIGELDKNKFFLLSKDACSRIDLFNIALALGLRKGYPTKLTTSKGLIRTAYDDVKAYLYLYKSVYFEKVILEEGRDIDIITDIDAVLELVEEYANTGFDELQQMKEAYSDSILFMKKLLTLIDEMRLEYQTVFKMNKLFTD